MRKAENPFNRCHARCFSKIGASSNRETPLLIDHFVSAKIENRNDIRKQFYSDLYNKTEYKRVNNLTQLIFSEL